MDFSSDNSYGVHPAIMEAVLAANGGSVPSYGDDKLTEEVTASFRDIFETDLDVFLVPTGTAGNVLSVSTFCSPIGSVFAHADAHLTIEECGAAEFYTGGAKVISVNGQNGQIDPANFRERLAESDLYGSRAMNPSVLSLTQATECGTVYTPAAISELVEIAKGRGLAVHMDGARFANAIAALECSPADITWAAGIDVMTFGATKNGAMSVEAIVLFDRSKKAEMLRRRIRAGHLLSKGRFMAAQLDAYFKGGLWLNMATHANAMATRLSAGLTSLPNIGLAWPTEANEVFAIMPNGLCTYLESQGARFYSWSPRGLAETDSGPQEGEDLRRMICSFDTSQEAVDAFLGAARGHNGQR